MTQPLFVSISGLIGAGKTTLARALGKELDLPVYEEPVVDSVYLEDFYKDPAAYGFRLQVWLLERRFRQQQQVIWSDRGGVQDRSIYEDSVFARMLHRAGHIDERDYQCYRGLFQGMSRFMQRPHVIVHLELSPEQALERVRKRARGCETGLTLEYLQALHDEYATFIEDISHMIPVIRVDWSADSHMAPADVARAVREQWEKNSTRYVSLA